MNRIRSSVSAIIDASPQDVYDILADYEQGHAAILPAAYFSALEIEAGGYGAGTVICFSMTMMGLAQYFHMVITEPAPGRVLMQSDPYTGQWTSYTVDPVDNDRQARVTIVSESEASPGLMGLLERLLNPPLIRRIFRQELKQLNHYVRRHALLSEFER